MSLPEISRRCRSCGAAVRAGARFCPQCGELMGEEPAAAAEPETRGVEPPAVPEPAPEVTQARDWTPPTKEFAAFAQSLEGAGARRGAGESPADPAASPQPGQAAAPPAVAPSEASNERAGAPPPSAVAVETPGAEPTPAEAEARRDGDDGAWDGASDASDARGRVARVREGTRARVERMRDEAIVVLEETPDDSGLRFVVAAAALFVVFVVLLLLSTIVFR